MSIYPRRLCVVAAAFVAFFVASPRAQALVLDWDSNSWASGSLMNSYDLNGDTLDDITLQLTSRQANIWANDPTTGTQSPVTNQTLTGGLLPVENSLMLAANLKTQSDATVQISFSGGVSWLTAANNVSFTLFDIDITTNSDIIDSIYGLAPDGSKVAATITNVGPSVTLTGSGLTQKLTGNAGSPDNSGNGNATISFASGVTDIFFTFSNTSGAPRYQDIAIGDISFTPVPEINPAAASVVSCLIAVGAMMGFHRRAKRRLPPPQS
jgi:hypothetical protein